MTQTPVDLLVQRIDRLERENRRFRPQPTQPGRTVDLSRPNVAANATLEVDADGAMGLGFFRGGTIWKAP